MVRAKLTAQVRARKRMQGGPAEDRAWAIRLMRECGQALCAAKRGRREGGDHDWTALREHTQAAVLASRGMGIETYRGELHSEWQSYYSRFPAAEDDDALRIAHKQRERKQDWSRKAREQKQAEKRAAEEEARRAKAPKRKARSS